MNLRKKLFKLMQTEKIGSDEYIKLAYLESSGTQMIDTGVAFQPIKAVIEVCFNEEVKTRQVMGFSSYNTTYFGKTSGGTFEVGGGITLTDSNAYQWQEVEFTHNGSISSGSCELTVDGKSIIRQNSITGQPLNFWLFNVPNYGTTLACHCKISGAKFYNANNELIADLIPILDKNFTPCMYDKVRHKFLYNQGEGEFKWRLPNQLECLESDGNQYLLTDYYPNSNTAVEVDYFPNPSSVFNCIYGTQSNGNTNRFYALISSINYKLQISSMNSSYYYGLDGVGGLMYQDQGFTTSHIRVVLTVDNYNKLIRTVTDDGMVDYDMTQVSGLGQVDCMYPLVIFNRGTAGVVNQTNGYKGKMYSYKIWESGKYLMYLIPVFDEDLTPCMYDLVSKQYLRNQGTGSFKGYFEDGSQLVSYLESDGNQWIDTGFIPSENHKMEVFGYSSKVNTGVSLVGTRNASNYDNRLQIWSDASGYFSARINGSTFVTTHPSTVKSSILLDIKNQCFTVNDSETYSLNYTGNLATNNYFLFLRNNGSGGVDTNYADPVVIYYFKLWDNDELVQYLIPVLDKNLTPCMYDLISSKHFYNKGSGEFGWILKNQLECLESTGTQYIDTGFLSKDLYDKSLYIKMKTTGGTSSYAYNGAYHISGTGLTIQFGLLTTSDTLCRTTMNHFDPSYLNVTDLQKSEYTEMMMTPTEYWVNGEFKANHEQTSVDQILETNNKFLLFGRSQYNQSNSITPMMISEFWIKDANGKFVQYLVPVFDENRVACMYDLVSKKYFLNENTTSNFTPILFNTGLFDPQNINFIPGYVSTNNSGNITDSTLTDTYYIPCEPNTSYIISRTHVKQSGQVWRAATVSESPYTGMLCPNYVGGLTEDLTLTITSGENDKYLMFSEGMTKSTDDLSKFSVYKSI